MTTPTEDYGDISEDELRLAVDFCRLFLKTDLALDTFRHRYPVIRDKMDSTWLRLFPRLKEFMELQYSDHPEHGMKYLIEVHKGARSISLLMPAYENWGALHSQAALNTVRPEFTLNQRHRCADIFALVSMAFIIYPDLKTKTS